MSLANFLTESIHLLHYIVVTLFEPWSVVFFLFFFLYLKLAGSTSEWAGISSLVHSLSHSDDLFDFFGNSVQVVFVFFVIVVDNWWWCLSDHYAATSRTLNHLNSSRHSWWRSSSWARWWNLLNHLLHHILHHHLYGIRSTSSWSDATRTSRTCYPNSLKPRPFMDLFLDMLSIRRV